MVPHRLPFAARGALARRWQRLLAACVVAACAGSAAALDSVPGIITHQGRIAVGGSDFNGLGRFQFALVDDTGAVLWLNDDGVAPYAAQPTTTVDLTVVNGLYSVDLGDTTIGMAAIPSAAFGDDHVYLRVWFNDGINGNALLSPDIRLTTVGYAQRAATASTLDAGAPITGATINNTVIGGTTPAAATVTALQVGTNGTTGRVTLYSEQGATDRQLVLQPNAAMTANTTLTFPPNAGSANQVLATDGAGNLSWSSASSGTVTSVATGAGLTGGPITGTGTIALDYGASLASSLAAGRTQFAGTGVLFEGATADANQALLTVADPTADRTLTLPDASGTVVTTGNLSAITGTGALASGSIAAGFGAIATGSAISTTRNGAGTGDASLAATGTPVVDATSSLVRIGGAIVGGDAGANGGTYLGMNAPNSFTGDLVNLQKNGTTVFRVDDTGAVTAGSITTGTWNGTTVGPGYGGTGTATTFTQGSVVFAGASGVYSQDNAGLFWDDANDRLGVGTATPDARLEIKGKGGIAAGNVTTAGATITGSGFTANAAVGMTLQIAGEYRTVISVTNDTTLVVNKPYNGAGYAAPTAATLWPMIERITTSAGATLGVVDGQGNFAFGPNAFANRTAWSAGNNERTSRYTFRVDDGQQFAYSSAPGVNKDMMWVEEGGVAAEDKIWMWSMRSGGGFQLYSNDGTNGWRLSQSMDLTTGYVGIMTASPTEALHVTGSALIDGADGDVRIGANAFPNRVAGTDAGGIALFAESVFRVGLVTEADGTVVSYGINAAQLGDRDNSKTGAFVRLDSRAGYPVFGVLRQPATTNGLGANEHHDIQLASTGDIGLGAHAEVDAFAGQVHVLDRAANVIGLVVEGAAAQAANLQEWRANGNATPLANVTAAGALHTAAALAVDGSATLGDASGDAVTINAATMAVPNGLNIDANTLVIDATADRVAIGRASPNAKLDVVGDVRLGDSTTNYTAVATNGAITYVGAARPKRSVILTAVGAIAPASGAAVAQTDGVNVSYYTVDYADGSTQYACWQFVVPNSYDAAATTCDVQLSWVATGATAGDVRWQVEMDGKAAGSAIDGALQAASATTSTAAGSAGAIVNATLANVASGWSGGRVAVVKVSRLGGDGSDTMTATAKLLQVRITWTANAESD